MEKRWIRGVAKAVTGLEVSFTYFITKLALFSFNSRQEIAISSLIRKSFRQIQTLHSSVMLLSLAPAMSELLNCDWGYFQVTPFVITEALPRCETLTVLFFGKKLD